MTQSTYSTPDEVANLIEQAYEAAQRLPCASQQELSNLVSGRDSFLGAVRTVTVVDPADADVTAGTTRYRRLHGLPALSITNPERTITNA
ncbi:MAG: hypothetical protein ACLQPH_20295 [Acidimicrobiales bacterium]